MLRKPKALALGVALAFLPCAAWAQQDIQAPVQKGAITLPEVKVTASEESAGELPAPYAGGQVARGGKLGVLGNRDMMDTPFTQTNYTAELIENQHVRHAAEVLQNDPTARIASGVSTGLDDFSIRGFPVSNQDIMLNGLIGVAPSFFNSVMAESIERVEVFKGPNALLNGVAQGSAIGGSINMVTKRADEEPLTQINVDRGGHSQTGVHTDISRRFGPDNAFGVRLNSVYRDGDTEIDNQSIRSKLIALGLDYRGNSFRISADLGYQEQDIDGTRRFSSVASGVMRLPNAPDSSSNFYDPYEFNNPEVTYGTLRGEYDFSEQLTAYVALGGSLRKTQYISTNRQIINEDGDLGSGNASVAADKMYARTWEAGLQGRFETGAVKHQMILAQTLFDRQWKRMRIQFPFVASNIYDPVYGPVPDSDLLPDPDDDTNRLNELKLVGTTFADTLSILDEKVQLTIGARNQRIRNTPYNFSTDARLPGYDEEEITPMVGLVLRPKKELALYASYIEGLQPGTVVGTGFQNEGETFAPYVTKQYEIGAKVDLGWLGMTLALYQISQPSQIEEDLGAPLPYLSQDGEQRHRGIDFNVFGEIMPGLRVLGGIAYIDSELTETTGGINDGNEGVGVPKTRAVLGLEWDTPFAPGLTLSGRVQRTGSMYLDPANTKEVPHYTRVDLGARYNTRVAGKPTTFRLNLENAFDEDYWETSGTQVALGDPRTLWLSASFDF